MIQRTAETEFVSAAPQQKVDLREQLYNDGAIGDITEIQVSTERIAQLRGIFFDLDPKLFKSGGVLPSVPYDPRDFYAGMIRPMLERHDVLKRAEVRNSGTGLHVILWFDDPVAFDTDVERDRWVGIVQVVQCALPIDPDSPHITAVTRPIGSANSKNGATVSLLHPGEPISHADVLQLFEEMVASPFKTTAKILLGDEKIEPCPVCREAGSRLSALDFCGQCYGSCGKVQLHQLYDLVFAPRPEKHEEGEGHDASAD